VSLVTEEKFPNQPNDSLFPKDDGPVNENAFEVEMQRTYGISNTFECCQYFSYIWMMNLI
jgi:hypothetical protein